MRLAAAALAFGSLLAAAAQPASTEELEYLYVLGNEGESAGGHAAIRFGAETFHFEHDHGFLRLRHEDSGRFEYVYRTLQNRDIELSRVPISAGTHALLLSSFRRRAIVQELQFSALSELERDVRLLEVLVARERARANVPGDEGFELRGAAFFVPVAQAEDAQAPRSLRALRRRIEARSGAGFLGQRRSRVELALAALRADPPALPGPSPDGPASLQGTLARRVESLLAEQLALELLAVPRPLRDEALARLPEAAGDPGADPFALAPSDRARLREASDALQASLARLLASPRADAGFPVLLGMARLAALERATLEGRLALPDAFPPGSETLPVTKRRRALLPALLAEARADVVAARAAFLRGRGFREADWNALEATASRYLELKRAEQGAATIRVERGALLPEGRGPARELPRLRADDTPLATRLAEARARERGQRDALAALYRYHLVEHNCVSELFRTLEAGLAAAAGRAARPGSAPSCARSRRGGSVATSIPGPRSTSSPSCPRAGCASTGRCPSGSCFRPIVISDWRRWRRANPTCSWPCVSRTF